MRSVALRLLGCLLNGSCCCCFCFCLCSTFGTLPSCTHNRINNSPRHWPANEREREQRSKRGRGPSGTSPSEVNKLRAIRSQMLCTKSCHSNWLIAAIFSITNLSMLTRFREGWGDVLTTPTQKVEDHFQRQTRISQFQFGQVMTRILSSSVVAVARALNMRPAATATAATPSTTETERVVNFSTLCHLKILFESCAPNPASQHGQQQQQQGGHAGEMASEKKRVRSRDVEISQKLHYTRLLVCMWVRVH